MDKEIKKSIELGFKGKLTPEFYAKWKATHKKRMYHLWELLGFIMMFTIFLWTYYIFDNNNSDFVIYLKILLMIFIIASLIAIYKNIMTWIDMFHVIKERFDEYEKNRHR